MSWIAFVVPIDHTKLDPMSMVWIQNTYITKMAMLIKI